MKCATCGYVREWHELGTNRCPGESRGKWRVPPPPDTRSWQQRIHDDLRARNEALEESRRPYVPAVVPSPQVPARVPHGPGEIAGYQGKQAVGMGRRAAAAGWQVAAYYWRAHDGVEACAVKMARDDLFAVATWSRKSGSIGKTSGWSADIAYGLRAGEMPVKLTHTQLEGVIGGH